MAKTALFYCEEAVAHNTGEFHPESPLRLPAILQELEKQQLTPIIMRPEAAAEEDILRNHTKAHVDMVRACCLDGEPSPDADTVMMPASWEAALLSAGAGISAAKVLLKGEIDNAFIAMRPPGHHAEAEGVMGFCLFNNIAITAHWLRASGAAERVAILDFDVHHGNGTQHAFYDDDTVLFVSMHEYPHFPGTGFPYERGKNDSNLNYQMPPGSAPERWISTLEEAILPRLQAFGPDFLLLSAGFDAHRLDPLGNQLLETEHFAQITRLLRPIAGGRIISFLEGGYHLGALGASAAAHIRVLMED
ncbi:MAG TPA: histone deacetylase [Candidatus Hydrogenedentes bacterium]|jgi:acetoin utilization deacetylase AcuC-like enzyme|nr:histone deacetylase [Candidatus Hydrogenedentota bacterium]HOR50001.1 histone deacetylase [Candidatus Hydrogenedentota bacterium]